MKVWSAHGAQAQLGVSLETGTGKEHGQFLVLLSITCTSMP